MIEDGEVDLDPGWDTAPLPPIEPILERDLPVDLALSGVMGVPEELFRPGRGKEAPTTPIRFLWAYCALTLALRTADGSMALLDLAAMGDCACRGEPLVSDASAVLGGEAKVGIPLFFRVNVLFLSNKFS